MKRRQRRGALGRLRGGVRWTTPERLRAAKAGERKPESRTRGEAGGGGAAGESGRRPTPAQAGTRIPMILFRPRSCPMRGKKLARRRRCGGSRQDPGRDTPGHGDLISETKSQAKTLSFLLTNNLVLGKSSPICARWRGNARRSGEPSLADAGERTLLWQQPESRGPGAGLGES